MTEQIPLNTLLGDRYKVTGHVLETSHGDTVLDGVDQVLGRKISIVLAAADHTRLLVSNARKSALLSRASVQVLDLGNQGDRTYLITSHTRPDTLLGVLLTEGEGNEAEAFGEEIFGDTGPMLAPNSYQVAKDRAAKEEAAAPAATAAAALATPSISATRSFEAPAEAEPEEFEDYDLEEEGYYEGEEPANRQGGIWVVGIAAVLLLAIGAGIAYSSLGKMVDSEASRQALGSSSASASASASASVSASAQPTASASPSSSQLPTARLAGSVTRTVPSAPSLMAESDSFLSHLTDGNEATSWVSLAFGSANFGGLTDSFYLSFPLEDATTVKSVTINQLSGVGGAFTVYASDSSSLTGAQKVGSGSFTASGATTVDLDQEVQKGETEYLLIQFTSAPQLSQPIVAGYPFGLRLTEVSVK